MKHRVAFKVLWSALVLACAGQTHGQSLIEGKVTLPKPQPAMEPPPRYEGQIGQVAPPDPPVAVVYLEGAFPTASTSPAFVTNQVFQLGMQFHPAVLPIQVGTTVAFPNEDDFYHNVFSYSKPKRFDLGRYRKDDRPPPTIIFDKPGVVKLYCEIHHYMRGVILVLDTPYFTRTQTNGLYRLENLPPGNFMLNAWIDEKHIFKKPVTLEPDQRLHVDFQSK